MTEPASNNPFAPKLPSLADLIETVGSDLTLHAQRRRNLTSSIRSFAKAFDKSPAQFVAHPNFLRSFLKRLHPEQCRFTKSRISNIKSDLQFALTRYVGKGSGRYMAPFSESWQTIWDLAVGQKALYARRSASRLMHFCSAQQISPDSVNDHVAARLLEALIEESLVLNPRERWKGILRAWNILADLLPSRSLPKLSIPDDSRTYTISLKEFPESFQSEVEAAIKRWSGSDLLDEDAPEKPLAPATLKKRRIQLRELASGLVLSGWDIGNVNSIAVLVEVEAAKTILRFYLERADGQKTSRVHGLAVILKTLARHIVGVEEDHYQQLASLCDRLDPKHSGMTEKNRGRLRPFDDPRNVGLILNLPKKTTDHARLNDSGTEKDALRVQWAVAVEILLMAPMRRKNLAGLHIYRHILRTRSSDGAVHLVIPGVEVKNGEPLDYCLPQETTELLDIYLRDFRPRLCAPDNPWLFPGQAPDKSKSEHTLSIQIKNYIQRETGLEVHVHLFRHLAAKLFLDQNPGQYESVRRHLGHRSMETTLRAYAGMETAAASRHFDATILKLRHQPSTPAI